ncbi:MAG: AI-2E family transporter [Aquificae bacterium]|nr:AI-2E family transporter [Aquificota bacterium]
MGGNLSFWVYLFFFLSLLLAFLYILMPFFSPIVWAIVMTIVFYPLYSFLRKKLKNEGVASLLVVVLVFFVMVIPVSVITAVATQQIVAFSIKLFGLVQGQSLEEFLGRLLEHPYIRENREKLEPLLNYIRSDEFRTSVLNALNNLLTFLGNKLKNIGNTFFHVFVFLLTLYFLLRDGEKILREVKNLIPMRREDTEEILRTVYRTVLAVIYGTVGTAVAQSVMSLIGYTLAGLDYALLWSILTFFAAFIPPFGAAFVWVPLDLYLFATKGIREGLILLVFGTLFISTMDNIVRPLVMKHGIKLPYVALFFATIGGFLQFGFIGIFLGPIILSTLLVSVKIYERRIMGRV